MTFEEALIQLKSGQKIIRQGWGGLENYIKLVESTSLDGEVLNVSTDSVRYFSRGLGSCRRINTPIIFII